MSLKKKIALSFFISTLIMAILVVLGYTNYIEVKKEIRYLELSDTIRSKSLQLRRHEKNYFLYRDIKQIESIHSYLQELKSTLLQNSSVNNIDKLQNLKIMIDEYGLRFDNIENTVWKFQKMFDSLKITHPQHAIFSPLIEATLLERPLVNAELLKKLFQLKYDHAILKSLRDLDKEINALRKTGEEILILSKELDKSAREKAESALYLTQIEALFLFPLFLIVGIGILSITSHSIVKRLKILSREIEKAGQGIFSQVSEPEHKWGKDEVGVLIHQFSYMEKQLAERENELLQSKKLAAIGTLASGVAHELNNPLNNIYTTAQRLTKKTGDEIPPFVKKGLDDIFRQTMRVKNIVADLLEFARGREPHLITVELKSHISNAYKHLGNTIDTQNVIFSLEMQPEKIFVQADPEQLEQVFINLFTNAVDAMSGEGNLTIKTEEENNFVKIKVSDTGKGIAREALEKIFEPFYTTKDKGTGLGLAIVFNIIHKHDGRIDVESKESEGTTFTITLHRGKA